MVVHTPIKYQKIFIEISEDIDQNNTVLARIASAGQARKGRVVGWWFILRSNIKKIFIEISEDIDQITWFLHELQVQGKPGKGGWLDGGWQLGTNGPLVQLPVRHTLPSVKQA